MSKFTHPRRDLGLSSQAAWPWRLADAFHFVRFRGFLDAGVK